MIACLDDPFTEYSAHYGSSQWVAALRFQKGFCSDIWRNYLSNLL